MPTQELVENVAALNPMLALRYFRLVTASEHFRIATDTKGIHHLYSLLASWRERTCTSTSAKASIKDRARAADLSPFAVARALRGSPRGPLVCPVACTAIPNGIAAARAGVHGTSGRDSVPRPC